MFDGIESLTPTTLSTSQHKNVPIWPLVSLNSIKSRTVFTLSKKKVHLYRTNGVYL